MVAYLLSAFLLIGFSSCNKSGTSEEASTQQEQQEEKQQQTYKQPDTDSVFVFSYIKKYPAFEEQKEWMYKFYSDRNYRLAWFRNNQLLPEANRFLEVITKADKEGLNPEDYQVVDFSKMFAEFENYKGPDSLKQKLQQEIDVALTASYFNYADDFYKGALKPYKDKRVDWYVKKNKVKLHKTLQTILKERESTYPYYQFEALHEGYTKLRDALQKYRTISEKGGWGEVDQVKLIEPGDTADAVVSLRKRLSAEYDLPVTKTPKLYDDKLVAAVKDFQERHGLEVDGKIGPGTVAMLNVPVEKRIDQIIINMERWRWVPKRMTPKRLNQEYIFVNIPEYKLYVKEYDKSGKDKTLLEMRVIVGKTMNSTPIFSDKLEYVVMSPYWNVPKSIIVNELKPGMLRNSNFLARQNMEVLNGYGRNAQVVSASSIDWANLTKDDIKFQVRQRPGPKNSLGMVKFIFPNEFDVYLHDTPADHLFNQTERGFSHGCVRVEKPVDLAEYLLRDQPNWTRDRIKDAMQSGEEKYVNLKTKVQVYIVYFTSWVDSEGRVNFREDIYGHDKELEEAYFS
ncbi:MAG: L,D-transpeptidase family protein [Hymenobacteraceae bacterium]|nr:L,D-transpeptidase family protein [Hymenobacteraceae bacterium]